jgi:hypothetical protein
MVGVLFAAMHAPRVNAQDQSRFLTPPPGVVDDSGFVVLRRRSPLVDTAAAPFVLAVHATAGSHQSHVAQIATQFSDSAMVRRIIDTDFVGPYSSDAIFLMLVPTDSSSFVRIEGGSMQHGDIAWPDGTMLVRDQRGDAFIPDTAVVPLPMGRILFSLHIDNSGNAVASVVLLDPGLYKGYSPGLLSQSHYDTRTDRLAARVAVVESVLSDSETTRIITLREIALQATIGQSRRLISFGLHPQLTRGSVQFPVDSWIRLADIECQGGGLILGADEIRLLGGTRVRRRGTR